MLLITAAALSSAVLAFPTWSTSKNTLLKDGTPTILHGMGTTTTEYLLRGIGMKSWATYDWANPAALITTVNAAEMAAITELLLPIASSGVTPIVRIPMTASYWLNVTTSAAGPNMAKYPDLSGQYRTLIGALVDAYTSKGIVAVLDLHWCDDDAEQQPMAQKTKAGGGVTGNAVTFWSSVAATFADNSLVFYELYNEPHITDVATYMSGDATTAGMLEMLAAVRAVDKTGICVIAGAAAYAYDATSLIALDAKLPAGETNVVYNFHPYMGPDQAGASNKCPAGFEAMITQLFAGVSKPAIITEFGQGCQATQGAAEHCPTESIGYDEHVLQICAAHGVSWMPWAWRPGSLIPNTKTCQDLNGASNGTALVHPTDGKGADWATLWAKYAGVTPAPPTPPGPTPPTPTPPTPTPPAGTCDGCGYNCDANCKCGRCNMKPGCQSEGQCMGACDGGHNAKWCGGGAPPAPTPPAPTPPTPTPPGPAPSGCPGGSLSACMALCPATPPVAYQDCVAICVTRCT